MQVLVLIEHEGLVAVLKEGEILELNEPDRDVILVDEETCEEHEWDNQNRGQGHC